MQRHLYKQHLINLIETQQALAPLQLYGINQLKESEDLTFRNIIAQGRFLHQQEILLQGKYSGNKRGVNIVTPLELENGTLLIVDRGWIPNNLSHASTRPQTWQQGLVFISGMVWKDKKPLSLLPQNQPEKNLWLWFEQDSILNYFREKNPGREILPYLVRQTMPEGTQQPEGMYPRIPEGKLEVFNHHLEYIFTWYLLAIIVAVMYFIYRRKHR